MWDFGIEHQDVGDDPMVHTISMPHAQQPDGYEYGRLHHNAIGLFVVQKPHRYTGFCGLFQHSGTAGLTGTDDIGPPVPWAIRVSGIAYPPRSMTSWGDTVRPFAAMPNGSTLNISPEMVGLA